MSTPRPNVPRHHSAADQDAIAALEQALIDPAVADQVDMVLSHPGPDRYRAASHEGAVEFTRHVDGNRHHYEIDLQNGRNPLTDTTTDRFVGLDAELATLQPPREKNSYPHAFDQIAQFFDSPLAPELVAQHTAGHRFDDNIGEHGSLGIVQARAPFIAAGAGVDRSGEIAESARMIDIAPTILRLLGGAPHPEGVGPTGARRPDALLRRQDGDPLDHRFEAGGADQVIVILLDGCNMNVVYDAIRSGAAPTIAALAARGTTFGHGLLASLPTATLANHTTASTGAHPGHTGVLHHTWWDRHRDATPDLLAMSEMFDGMRHLRSDVETIHQAVHRNLPDAFTASCFEFCDTGADFSSFAEILAQTSAPLPDIADLLTTAVTNPDYATTSAAYGFMSTVDELATRQAVAAWAPTTSDRPPAFTWLSLSLTDEAGHEAGPHAAMTRAAVTDSDARVARLVDAVERRGALDSTAFLVFSDHGMEANTAGPTTSWQDALDATGVAHRDVSHGFIYLDRRG